jgi:hypothetical protein
MYHSQGLVWCGPWHVNAAFINTVNHGFYPDMGLAKRQEPSTCRRHGCSQGYMDYAQQ